MVRRGVRGNYELLGITKGYWIKRDRGRGIPEVERRERTMTKTCNSIMCTHETALMHEQNDILVEICNELTKINETLEAGLRAIVIQIPNELDTLRNPKKS